MFDQLSTGQKDMLCTTLLIVVGILVTGSLWLLEYVHGM